MTTSLQSSPRALRLRSLRSLRLKPREPFGHHFTGHCSLWSIICEFVALGFNVHPLQQVPDACGKRDQNPANQPLFGADELRSKQELVENGLSDATANEALRTAEGAEK